MTFLIESGIKKQWRYDEETDNTFALDYRVVVHDVICHALLMQLGRPIKDLCSKEQIWKNIAEISGFCNVFGYFFRFGNIFFNSEEHYLVT